MCITSLNDWNQITITQGHFLSLFELLNIVEGVDIGGNVVGGTRIDNLGVILHCVCSKIFFCFKVDMGMGTVDICCMP